MEAGVVLVIAVVVAYLWGQHEAQKAAKWFPPSEEELERKYPTEYRDYEEYAVAEAVKEVEREEREARKHRRKRRPGIDAPKPLTEQDHINAERWEKARRNAEKADRDARTAIPYADRPAAYLGLNEQEWIRMRGNLPGVLPAGSMSVLDRMWDDYLQDLAGNDCGAE